MVPGDLRDKYARMRALRENHARARRDAAWEEPDPRPELARLAAEYPGALREIDRLPAEVIDARIAELDAFVAGAPIAPWMGAQLLFHSRARAVLAAKRWLAGRKMLTEEERAAFVAIHPDVAEELDAILAPRGGRIVPLVVTYVAARLGVSEAQVRSLVFGSH